MKIVVTGALGHIGSKLIRELPSMYPDCKILMVDNFRTERYSSLFNLPEFGGYQFIEADITTAPLNAYFRGADILIHLAAITNAETSGLIPKEVHRVNYEGLKRVAESCAEVGVKLIFPSTTSVYGKSEGIVAEDCPESELKPQSAYAESKLNAEKCLAELRLEKGLQYTTFRFGTIFGTSPGMRFHTAINKFCFQASLGQSLSVWETAFNQKRPYLDLGDALQALYFVMQQDLFEGEIYNVVTTNTTVATLLDEIRKLIPDVKVDFVASEIMNQLSYEVSDDKIKALGFEPKGNLSLGIQETLELLNTSSGALTHQSEAT